MLQELPPRRDSQPLDQLSLRLGQPGELFNGLIEYVNELVPSFQLQRSGMSDGAETWTQEHFERMSA